MSASKDTPSRPSSPSPPSPTGDPDPRDRRASTASYAPSITSSQAGRDREQLAQTLDLIHTSASRTDALTTFNDFAEPPEQNAPVVENKGLASDLVQQGLSGLYTRFKEAVGGVGIPKLTPDTDGAEAQDAASRPSSNTPNPASRLSISSPTRTTTGSTFNTAVSETASSSTWNQSHASPAAAPSSRQSISGAAQVLAAIALDTASATAIPSREVPRSTVPSDDGLSRVSGSRRSLSRTDIVAPGPVSELPKVYDGEAPKSPVDRVPTGLRLKRDEVLKSEAGGETPLSPVKSTAPSSIQSGDLRAPSTAGSAVAKTPALIERISGPRSPTYTGSHSSSVDLGGIDGSSRNNSSLHSLHHESGSRDGRSSQPRAAELRVPGTVISEAASEQVNTRLEKMKKQVLSKEFWMADETCKECFSCGAVFNVVRRKHHCRTCGCIFDSKCTSIISGQKFGVSGNLRVCKTCLAVINRRYDTSGSDDSADDSYLPAIFRSNPIIPGGGRNGTHSPSPANESKRQSAEEVATLSPSERGGEDFDGQTPMMAIPATRRIGESNRRSAVLEIDAPQVQLSRPGSSRSLKSMASARPQSSGHKRHHSKHNLLGRLKTDDRAPFRKSLNEEMRKPKFPAFHADNIIDPELADYMSDESSADEQMGIFATMTSTDLPSNSFENDKSTFGPLLTAGKRHRMRDKSISGMSFTSRGLDDNAGGGNHLGYRHSRRRNLSIVSSGAHHLRSPRPKSGVFKGPSASNETVFNLDSPVVETTKLTRSDSLRGDKAPQVELNPSSKRHVQKLLHQLLQDAGVPSVAAWERALVPILIQCTDDVTPDVRNGDFMDIRHYVKFKKIPGGRPGDTSYVSGVIFTKNLALKSMPRRIIHPRIVIVSFPIEYQRHQQHFMSLQPVIEQEKEFLRIVVNRIVKLNPQVLLAEKGVSGMALELLSAANIAVAYNVKPSVIEAVARCAEADIISSIDMLALTVRVGYCDGFEVKTYVNHHHPGKKKSYIFLSGCTPSLGCTIALRGAPRQALASVKRITEFMVYVVYNLKLETCLMRDEFIHIPTEETGVTPPLGTRQATEDTLRPSASTGLGLHLHDDAGPSPAGPTVVFNAAESEPPSQTTVDSWEATVETPSQPDDDDPSNQAGEENSLSAHPAPPMHRRLSMHQQHTSNGAPGDHPVPEDIPMPTYYSDMVARYETKILSASPFVKFTQPYLLMRAREQERRLVYLKRLRDQDVVQEPDEEKSKPQPFQLIKPDMVHAIGQTAPGRLMEVIHAVHDAEYDKALHNYQTHTRQWENYIQGNINLFDPYSHQNIVVLHSVICTDTKIPCVEPGLIAIGFYDEQHLDTGMDADCTLGQYIEDLCCSKDNICASNGCDKTMVQHHRTYVHDEARITIFLEDTAQSSSSQMNDDITMWNYCKVCKKDSPAMPMCESTWKYSFGKYLELLFWSKGLRLNDKADCPHDHHKDHIRYFTFRDTRVRIHYDPIELLEIIVPRPRITWKVENDLNLKNDIYTKIEERWSRYMVSVKARLKNIRIDVVLPEKADSCQAEVDRLMKKAQDDHAALIRKMQQIYLNSKYYEVIPFNAVIRQMLEVADEWDMAFAQFEIDFLPDKDVRQLTVLQLKKMFTDNESKESLPTPDSATYSSIESDERPSQTFTDSDGKLTQPTDDSNGSLADSGTSTKPVEPHTSPDDAKELMATDAAMERVEPLDLATLSPVTSHTEQPSDTSVPEVPGTPTKQVASGMPSDISKRLSMEVTPSAEESATPKAEASRSQTPQAQPPKMNSEKTLQEKVELLKRRNQTMPVDLVNPRSSSTDLLKGTIPERLSSRRAGMNVSPPMIRSRTQPNVLQMPKAPVQRAPDPPPAADDGSAKPEKKFTERLAGALKTRKPQPSAIPRLVHKKESKVSTLARHFEQLSREFENQRIRDRKKRAEKMRQRQPRTLLPRTSTAIVEVYEDVNEAVQEHGPSETGSKRSQESENMMEMGRVSAASHRKAAHDLGEKPAKAETEQPHCSENADTETPAAGADDDAEAETKASRPSFNASEDEGISDVEPSLEDLLPEVKAIADSLEPTTEELPKHQKTSLLKLLTNFWAERSSSGWQPLDYPVSMTDHIFMDSDIIVREDEPSSLIAFALGSEDYQDKLADIRHQWHLQIQRSGGEDGSDLDGGEPKSLPSSTSGPESIDEELEKSLLRVTGTHLKYQFSEGSARMTCKIFYAEQFDALRRKCGVADRFVESLSRCLKWDSRGGKTRAVFLKTLDDRFVLKSLSSVETAAFLGFAPSYFGIMAEALFHELPSVIAKMVGFFQIFIKNPVSNTDVKLDLLVMENLFYDRSPGKIFDLKGSMRNRKIQSTGEQNEVLLDENMVEYIYESPLFAREHSKKLLRASVWNDTLFLARQNVMDYSLMIAIDEGRRELVVGIIDCIRTYTLDKKLESWIKDRGLAGGGRNRPTITSPKEYKSRFREAMARYVLSLPPDGLF
ncbi:related to phosphatidylinositol 4-phosphate 5-kinase [Cephalotrichum gorgonifer]|uniref:1-phosphatidylinositol-3-phosphate 5-kinase n=1 Tax=Cephalotrichum gorgonifer TaxID=2041049 RepID=A0AAE8MZ30_9PEZI|nr:related to phosphatidylinositol 4-phosphate 5-kinase [Cephalotrichum gorgonifer]